jgi:hypothetical protein
VLQVLVVAALMLLLVRIHCLLLAGTCRNLWLQEGLLEVGVAGPVVLLC